jgi:CubicO group peptidase (beta-lactamase class C family)
VYLLNTSIDEHAFSGVISICQQGIVLYESAAGYADRSNQIQNTLETRFGIASGTKFFTALAIGKLIEARKLSFSTKVNDCIILGFPSLFAGDHHQALAYPYLWYSGLLDEEKITDFDNFTLSTPWYELKAPSDYLAAFPDEAMKFKPGERFSYSNGGYILLGVVIEKLSGMKYQDFVGQSIFKAISMSHSGYFTLNKLPKKTIASS